MNLQNCLRELLWHACDATRGGELYSVPPFLTVLPPFWLLHVLSNSKQAGWSVMAPLRPPARHQNAAVLDCVVYHVAALLDIVRGLHMELL